MSDFFKDIIKQTGNEYASLVSDGVDLKSGKNNLCIQTYHS